MKLYRVTLDTPFADIGAGDTEIEAAQDAFYNIKEQLMDLRTSDFRVELIAPGDPDMADAISDWGGELTELDREYYTCPDCENQRWIISTRSDGRDAVEACDSCRDPDRFDDEDAADLARAAGIKCESTYPCYVLKED